MWIQPIKSLFAVLLKQIYSSIHMKLGKHRVWNWLNMRHCCNVKEWPWPLLLKIVDVLIYLIVFIYSCIQKANWPYHKKCKVNPRLPWAKSLQNFPWNLMFLHFLIFDFAAKEEKVYPRSLFQQSWYWCYILSFKAIRQLSLEKKTFKTFYHIWAW